MTWVITGLSLNGTPGSFSTRTPKRKIYIGKKQIRACLFPEREEAAKKNNKRKRASE